MSRSFSSIFDVVVPETIPCDPVTNASPEFTIKFAADGPIPFPQLIFWEGGAQVKLIGGEAVREIAPRLYAVTLPERALRPGNYRVQIEGCKRADIERAGGDDWVKVFVDLRVAPAPRPVVQAGRSDGVRVYFGIHKHMHQPYYDATDPNHWDGEKESIFGQRRGAYSDYIPAAVRQYIDGGLPHAGLSTSFSGTLIAQLERCARDGLCGGGFRDWNQPLTALARERTALGHPRVAFTAFGFHHPLMALIPERDIVRSIELHRAIIERAFGVGASRVLFPPETAFHVRMIPALRKAGVETVIYDSIHRYRTSKGYPYAGKEEGMLPPNPAEQVNPAVSDWMQLQNVWAGSKISPSLLRPETIAYEDPEGKLTTIIGVPAERYIGNEDARGGFGALQYPSVLGQVYDRIIADRSFDPEHPPFFLLHSDGDNYGGGTDSYYKHNTTGLVNWLREDHRFELTTIDDYLERFPPAATPTVHIEPGSWSGADNGDPQFRKWFSRVEQDYSPDLNSWAVLTAMQNLVHSLEDAKLASDLLPELIELMLRAETSCYWYWTGQEVWDRQVTQAANRVFDLAASARAGIAARDRTGPTIFAPWLLPENPGGKTWGQGGLVDAPPVGILHTFVHDVSGLERVDLVLRQSGRERRLPLRDQGPYPSRTGARSTAHHFTAELPRGAGDVRYFVEALDRRGNLTRSSLERAFLA